MKNHNEVQFNQKIEPLDWRYSATIVGLYKYFNLFGKENVDFRITDDAFEFNEEDITEERYYDFADFYFQMQGVNSSYKITKRLLSKEELTKSERKLLKDKLKIISLQNVEITEENHDILLELVEQKRINFIKERYAKEGTYRYKKFINVNERAKKVNLFDDRNSICRLVGYYVDKGRKTKSNSYNFSNKTFVYHNNRYFDFIPFAFVGDTDYLFINDSLSVNRLIDVNIMFDKAYLNTIKSLHRKVDITNYFIQSIAMLDKFVNSDVEVIYKNNEKYFSTLYVRQESIDVIKNYAKHKSIKRLMNLNDLLNGSAENIYDCIFNLCNCDCFIESLLKEKVYTYLSNDLIYLNLLILNGGKEMDQNTDKNLKSAIACGKIVTSKLADNKLKAYRDTLLNTVILHDYNRCIEILLQMSNYTNTNFGFLFALIEDFEKNKNVMYMFINYLGSEKEKNDEEKENENEK